MSVKWNAAYIHAQFKCYETKRSRDEVGKIGRKVQFGSRSVLEHLDHTKYFARAHLESLKNRKFSTLDACAAVFTLYTRVYITHRVHNT